MFEIWYSSHAFWTALQAAWKKQQSHSTLYHQQLHILRYDSASLTYTRDT